MGPDDPREAYDALWEASWHGELESPGASYRTRRRLFLRLVDTVYTPGASVLDVGCGNGSLLADIAMRHTDVGELVGVDVAEAAVARARRTVTAARFEQCDPQREALPASFDIVTACEVLEHVPDYRGVLRRMYEAMAPGAHLVISVPHGMRYWGPHDEAVFHVRRFEHDELRDAVEEAGFSVVESFTWGSVLYRMYYAVVLNRVAPQATGQSKGGLMRLAHGLLYRLLYFDDLFISTNGGRMLFLVAQLQRGPSVFGLTPERGE